VSNINSDATGVDIREFHLRLQPLNPSDDYALELWSLDYKKPSFEDEYNLKLVATLSPTLMPF
jgi:exopolyphosphatase/guanosine-5'-triphosphate,3'-diphosphate pyrophosphatase